MRKDRFAKVIAMGLVCSMAFLSACGKKDGVIAEGGDRPATEIDKDHVYSFEDVDIPVGKNSSLVKVCANKDSLLASVYDYSSETGHNSFYKVPFETGEASKLEINGQDNASVDNFAYDDDGNVYVLAYTYGESDGEDAELYEDSEVAEGAEGDEAAEETNSADDTEAAEGDEPANEKKAVTETAVDSEAETSDAETTESENSEEDEVENSESDSEADVIEDSGEYDHTVSITKLTAEGKTVWDTPIVGEDKDAYVRSMVYAKGLGVLTCSELGVNLYDESNGQCKSLYKREQKENSYYDGYLFSMKNGDVYLIASEDGSDTTVSKLDTAQMSFTDTGVKLPDEVYDGYGLFAGKSYDFYYHNGGGIEAFNLGDDKTTEICDFTASNALVNMVNFICETDDGRLVVSNSSGDDSTLSYLTKVDPSSVEEREVLTLGTVFISDEIRKQVVKFNKASDKYKISVVDYADLAGEEAGDDENSDIYMTGINKLSLDITQGKAPDIIVVENNMPFESYAIKGAIEPLDPYFEADEDVSIADYLSNVLESTKVKGQMYSIIPKFDIVTCVVAKDNTNGEVITLDNYKEVCERLGIDPKVGMGMLTRSDARSLYETIGSSYVNYEDGTCSFDTDGFIKLLEFIKELPEDTDEDIDYDEYEAYYRENKSLMKGYWLSSFEDYQVLKKGYFGKDIEFNGYPTNKDGKSYIQAMDQIAMSSSCKDKQAVWEFMKSFISEDYQKNIEWGFPIERKAMDALAKKAQEKPYYIDENGKKVETTSVWSIGGLDVNIEALSEEETQDVVGFIESVTNSENRDENVIKIIEEEAAAYYEGQKSAEEVADIIQSRVSIYLSEQM
ncbi:extracellular solute-binding protein [Butyrivibrio sp. JL13D10]|uniref:extracellular solute-binding protein n=1 Tax=Butyrivibrio sp. JL13D10 TaxID=3236815 RepID=UPI0038B47941